MGKTYESLGASASKAGLHRALQAAGIEEDSGFFCKLDEDIAGDPGYYSFIHCDGAGTKSIVAYLLYRETGDPSHFAGLAQDALVMNLDDIYCVGTPERLVVGNVINRNKHRFDDEALATLIKSYATLIEDYRKLGIPLSLGGGETGDCGDIVLTVAIDAIVSGRIKKSSAINANRIATGDVIIGLSSTGQTTYEQAPNSGIGSNGFTLARHALLSEAGVAAYPEAGGGKIEAGRFTGPYRVTDSAPGLTMSVGKALVSPTRTYAPILAAAFAELGPDIHACIHCSGGGQTKVLRFGRNKRYVKDNLFPTPPLFQLIQESGKVDWREMYQVFNMGHRMEIYAPASAVARIEAIAKGFAVEARVVGRVEEGRGLNDVLIRSPYGEFSYQLQ